jgi:hypothetical protein
MGRKADINSGAVMAITVVAGIVGLAGGGWIGAVAAFIVLAAILSFLGILR